MSVDESRASMAFVSRYVIVQARSLRVPIVTADAELDRYHVELLTAGSR